MHVAKMTVAIRLDHLSMPWQLSPGLNESLVATSVHREKDEKPLRTPRRTDDAVCLSSDVEQRAGKHTGMIIAWVCKAQLSRSVSANKETTFSDRGRCGVGRQSVTS